MSTPRPSAGDAIADPVTVGVVQELLISVVREMRLTFSRSAFSSIISEGHDFSCALLSPDGELVAQSEDHPGHIFPLSYAARAVMGRYAGDIHPGDVFIINDPYVCGTHMNDIAVFCPRVLDGRMLVFPAIRAHWGDVGGSVAGSLSGDSTHIFQEGTVVPPIRLYSQGELDEELLDLMLSNMRGRRERNGDLMAAIGTCRVADRRLTELEDKYGQQTLPDVTKVLLDRTERRMRDAIRAWPDGTYYSENYMDNSGTEAEPLRISLRLDVAGDDIRCDFSGTSSQVPGPTNGGLATTATSCFMVLKSFLDPKASVNAGYFRPLTVEAPKGTILNAQYPSPMGGASEIRRTVEATVLGAVAQIVPDESCGDTKGSANHCYIAGRDPGSGEGFLYYEYPCGGTGAVLGNDGEDVIRTYNEGDFNAVQPVESLESRLPLLVEESGLRIDSCGHGQWRGGLGMERKVRVEAAGAALTVLTDRVVIPPYGVCAGGSGGGNRFTVLHQGREVEPSEIPGKATAFPLEHGDVVVLRSAGGGGFGDPLRRDAAAVLADCRQGCITAGMAREVYGVVIEDGVLDEAATDAERRRIGESRVHLSVRLVGEDRFAGARRLCQVSPAVARRLGVGDGGLVEYVPERGMPLRAFARVEPDLRGEETEIGPIAARILAVPDGARVHVRAVASPYAHPPL
jgi:N-methylhydantoinase B